ncbi:hypothetical protein LguiB_024736 [Lonicera macranthoides]
MKNKKCTHQQHDLQLIDAPPYSNIYMISRGFEANYDKVKKADTKRVTEYIQNGDLKIYEEDVDAEAEDFIKHEHKKFELGKWM